MERFCLRLNGTINNGTLTTISQSACKTFTWTAGEGKVPRKIVPFAIPTGYSFNMDGTSLCLSLACAFVAQVAGVYLFLGEQVNMCVVLMLTSKRVARVSCTVLVILLGTLSSFDLPTTPVFLLLGIDVLLVMGRIIVNVIGNCTASIVMDKWENTFDEQKTIDFSNKL
jgi:proton glutamate symport protein